MNVSNVTLNNVTLNNNTSKNISQNFILNNLSDNKIETLNNSLNSSSVNLYPFIEKNFQPIMVITFGVPFTAIIYFKTKLSNLKNNATANELDIKIIKSSISYISGWLLTNIFIIFYLAILNPTVFSYNQTTTIVSASGLLLFMFAVILIWIEDVAFLLRRFHDFKCYINSKLKNFFYMMTYLFKRIDRYIYYK